MIKLGCVIGNDKSEHIISEDVRKDLFGSEKDLSIHKAICNRSVIAWNAVSTMNWKKGKMNMLVSPGLLK